MLRELARTCGEILTEACEEGGQVNDKLDTAEQRIFEVTEKKIQGSVSALKDLLNPDV